MSTQIEQLTYFVQHAPVAMAMLDKDFCYVAASKKYVDVWLRKRPFLGKNHYVLFPDVPERWKEVHERCLKGVTESCDEDAYERADGTIDYIDWVTTPWYNDKDEIGGIILYTEIVNERVEAKHKLLSLNKKLKQSNQKLQSLAYAVSHNLQEPLLSGEQMVDEAEQALKEGKIESVSQYLDALRTFSKRLRTMVEGFLQYSFSSNEPGVHMVDLEKVLQIVIENVTYPSQQRPSQILHESLPTILANEFEMMALFQNLIGNALKHNDSELPSVRIRAIRREGMWEFQVKDNGKGMRIEDQEEAFQMIRSVDRKAEYDGVGVGLPICWRIIHDMEGKMWLESELGTGTTVYFTIPDNPNEP